MIAYVYDYVYVYVDALIYVCLDADVQTEWKVCLQMHMRVWTCMR